MSKKMDLELQVRLPYGRCNYRCRYCRNPHEEDVTPSYLERLEAGIQAASRFGVLGISFDSIGEPLMSKKLRTCFTSVANMEHVRFINITTNGSLLQEPLAAFLRGIPPEKLSLNCTLHDDEVPSIDGFFRRITWLKDAGIHVVVHYVARPNVFIRIPRYKQRLDQIGVKLAVNAWVGHIGQAPYPNNYDKHQRWFLSQYMPDESFRFSLEYENPHGRLCHTGHRSVCVWLKDCKVYRCQEIREPENCLGTLEDFEIADGPRPCTVHDGICACPRYFLWLDEAVKKYHRTTSFREYYDRSKPLPAGAWDEV